MPEPSAPFVFRDGFEGSAKIDDLVAKGSARWNGVELQSAAGPTANSVALSSERAHSGNNALKCVAAPFDGKNVSEADIERQGLRFVKGDDVWFSAWYWLEGHTEGSSVFLWDLESTALRNTPGRRLFLQNGEMVASDLGKWWSAKKFRAVGGAPKFPKNRWVEVKIHLHLSDREDGRMQVWQDGVKVLDEAGKTLPRARTVYDRMQVGLTANTGRSAAQTLFVDDVVLSNRPL
ncbi:MAG: heparin lyase I family protein [Verrucomicrobia bacterium]|nr:heparin lyase I family protein [Verrucomicrobiota bacterium]